MMVSRTIEGLGKNNMAGHYLQSRQGLLPLLDSLMVPGAIVGCGDSVTLEKTGVFAHLRSGGYQFLDKHRPGLTGAEKRAIYLQNFRADVFVTGTNAVTADGQLFNIDGNGSRVAPMLYGPERVIVVAGINKLVRDVNEAVTRVRQVAAPLDAVRLGKDTPCARTGKCCDCHHPDRICNSFVLIRRQFIEGRIHVILIDEKLGF